MVSNKLEIEPVIVRNISLKKPGPLNGGSTKESIC